MKKVLLVALLGLGACAPKSNDVSFDAVKSSGIFTKWEDGKINKDDDHYAFDLTNYELGSEYKNKLSISGLQNINRPDGEKESSTLEYKVRDYNDLGVGILWRDHSGGNSCVFSKVIINKLENDADFYEHFELNISYDKNGEDFGFEPCTETKFHLYFDKDFDDKMLFCEMSISEYKIAYFNKHGANPDVSSRYECVSISK